MAKRLIAAISALLFAFALSATATAASMTPPQPREAAGSQNIDSSLSENELDELRAFLQMNHVPASDQDTLINKLEEGIPWDSLNNKSPVSVETIRTRTEERVISRFEDGSVSVSALSLPSESNNGTGLRSVSSCKLKSSSNYHANYTGCYGNVDFGIIQMGFHFDRETNPGALGRITRAYGMQHRCLGCTLSNHRLEKFSPQRVRYSADSSVLFKDSPLGTTAWMEVHHGYNLHVWTTHN